MLYKNKSYFLFFFLCIMGFVAAQEQDIHGVVVVDFVNDYPEDVEVTNVQTKTNVQTDSTGAFTIAASVGDTLKFDAYFLIPRKLVVKPLHFKLNPLKIHMNEEIIKLEDIVVRPPLTGDLNKDMAATPHNKDIETVYNNLGLDIRMRDTKPKERIGVSSSSEGMIPIPLTLNIGEIVNAINGDTRKLRNLYRYEDLENKLQTVLDYFGDDYLEKELKIQGGKGRQFLLFVYGREKQAFEVYFKDQDFLSLDELMRNNAPIFNKRLWEWNQTEIGSAESEP